VQLAGVDLLLVPTALHHYTLAEIEAQEQAPQVCCRSGFSLAEDTAESCLPGGGTNSLTIEVLFSGKKCFC
jgi:hypothetical protein